MKFYILKKPITLNNINYNKNINYSTFDIAISFRQTVMEICDAKLRHLVPIPKSKTTMRSYISPRNRAKETDGDSQFEGPKGNPNPLEKKKLIGVMAASVVDICMSNHYYTIGREIRRQKEGGAIGSDLTGEEARIYMLLWDSKLMERCKQMGIFVALYK